MDSLYKFMNQKLIAKCTPSSIMVDQNYQLIADVRELKSQIKDHNLSLEHTSEKMKDLNSEIIKTDQNNAIKVLGDKASISKERLTKVATQLKKVNETSINMNHNTSTAEEQEFIDTVLEQM